MVSAFVDANVIVSVLNKEYPLFTYSSRVLSSGALKGVELYTSPLCLAIGFYFASKKSGRKMAKKKLAILSEHFTVATINAAAIHKAMRNPKVEDVEDGFQYYAAVEAGCRCIVTENGGDFYFSEMPVLSSEEFLKTYVFK
ncbi:type II toxin-antitoxin system VapC family toxin [Roseivirga pacifica]|uniref:type II toxin-antitoxin system VapC family toxin n=1 Tax=Roseivirga pacifica TaxID=1267423 RepID=UPI003BB1DEB9